jgi:hypothetical protein
MPVRKFRDVAAMDAFIERERAERGVDWEAIAHVFAIAEAGAPRRMVPGLYKFRTVEEWNAASARWEAASVEAAARRAAEGSGDLPPEPR